MLFGRRRWSSTIAECRTRQPQNAAGHPLRTGRLLHQFLCHRPAMGRAHSFFSHTASNTRFLSSDSASIFFNSLFSFSSSFSRRASLISMCPNCFFHRWKVTSDTFSCRQMSWMLFSPRSASRRMRILSSVVYRLPFIVWSFLTAQTNTSGGPKKRSHVKRIKKKMVECFNHYRRNITNRRQHNLILQKSEMSKLLITEFMNFDQHGLNLASHCWCSSSQKIFWLHLRKAKIFHAQVVGIATGCNWP